MKIKHLTLAVIMGMFFGNAQASETESLPPGSVVKAVSSRLTPDKDVRREDQTFLTIPEWYLVQSPNEYADFIHGNRPSDFPFFGHIRQFWGTYGTVYRETKDRYEFNGGYHVMVMTIGISTTIEYAIKGSYEKTIGRLTESGGLDYRTDEDEYAAMIARDYVDFIVVDPWYKYDFTKALKGLWTELPNTGPHPIRKWERRAALSAEYAVKAGYAWLIKKATQASFDAPSPVTVVVATFPNDVAANSVAGIKIVKKFDGGVYLVELPRYQAFSDTALSLAKSGGEFQEIAGNKDFIVFSVLGKRSFDPAEINATVILQQPILTQPDQTRIVYRASIKDFSQVLNRAVDHSLKIEHIYDF